MKAVTGLVVTFKEGRQREFKLTKEANWQFVFCLKWVALFYPDHENIELMRKGAAPGAILKARRSQVVPHSQSEHHQSATQC